MDQSILLVGTRKGAFILHDDGGRKDWRVSGPHFLGSAVHHMVLDRRDGKTLLLGTRPGHLGPTVFRSSDLGAHWQEAAKPPAFAPAADPAAAAASVDIVFWLTPGHADDAGVWYAGTVPPGLFRSADGGNTWQEVAGLNSGYLPGIQQYIGAVPGGPPLHSICIDPRDAAHMYIAISSGGVFETGDAGETWRPLNRGVAATFMPDPAPELGHDPHRVAQHPLAPDRLYQQNHCGIYRLDRPGETWQRIGAAMPAEVGDIGFPVVLHPRDPDTLWVFPMDGTENWPRTSPDGRPAVYCSRDGGESWARQDDGLPREQAWWTVKRQAFCVDSGDPAGLYFGTTSGQLWASADEGATWRRIAEHLPEIFAVEAATVSS
ncbi:WD40/YVTN/BNR-like repeat-containing protein [Aromatoleum diolicum]|uniref:Glycosyl hydrolase n=1 Tax=Aromatoleum diolicum TaxID=75796 RepID=A0ABX1QD35_9RHOO|nr:glycosyl hydrolase [Aromatoleum diolicum]NMG75425.1 glycosyl hydrolase [Aromatoleum diolicum]